MQLLRDVCSNVRLNFGILVPERKHLNFINLYFWKLFDPPGHLRQIGMFSLGVQSWSPFVIRKSGHIMRIWAEMTQTLMPKSTKVAQIHLPECNSGKICQISAKIRQNLQNFRQNSRQISQISLHKRALTLNTQFSLRIKESDQKNWGFLPCSLFPRS